MRYFVLFLLILPSHFCFGYNSIKYKISDTSKVVQLNKESYNLRFTDPNRAIIEARKAHEIADKLGYKKGKAESYRMIGIAYNYLNKKNLSLNALFKALAIFKEINDIHGEAKVLNNIGNVYNQYDNEKALEFYLQTLEIATRHGIDDLIAGSHLNMGTIYFRQKDYNRSLTNSLRSKEKFIKLNNTVGVIQATQSIGVNYFSLKEYALAEKNLISAKKLAEKENLIFLIGSINLTLASLNTINNKFSKAEYNINEGLEIANKIKDSVLLSDFLFKSYELEKKRGNYKKSIEYLLKTFKEDSIIYEKNIKTILELNEKQKKYEQQQKQKEYELKLAKQKNTLTLFVASIIVLTLSLILIFLLIRSKKKTEKTNKELLHLNQEISQQKENLDRINTRLEEIITDRTKDLISKNRKLSEYSSHLSHQVRGPVATLKGLIMLSQDNLIEEKECIAEMKKCIDDIDEQIMDINIALHDPDRKGLSKKKSQSGNL